MKKVFFFLPTLRTGGAEMVATQLSFFFKEQDTNFILLENKIELPYRGNIEILGLENKQKRGTVGKIKKLIYLYVKLKNMKKHLDQNIVISFMSLQNILNVLTKKSGKTIISVRSFESLEKGNTFFYKLLIRLCYPHADAIVCVSKYAAKDLVDNFSIKKEKIHIIYNPVDITKINQLKNENILGYEDIYDTPTLVYVATLKAGKGHDYLFKIFKKLKERNTLLKLILVGDGPIKDELINLAYSYDLRIFDIEKKETEIKESDIVFVGHQDNPYKFMSRGTIFVFPSLWEGFPNVLIEAMACQIPIVSADCPSGPREIIAPDTECSLSTEKIEYHENGILVPYFNANDYLFKDKVSSKEQLWVDAIQSLLDSKKLQDEIIECASKSLERYTPDNIVNKWYKVFSFNNEDKE